jgi:hypothetical protein
MTDLFAIQETSLAVLREGGLSCLSTCTAEGGEGGTTDFSTLIPWYFAVSQIHGAVPRIKICP